MPPSSGAPPPSWVVPLVGGLDHEGLVAIGDVLSGLGVDLSSLLRAQLANARPKGRGR